MPILPSGLKLAISDRALFDHGGNWFQCPEGHFWYWTPDLKIMGPGPYQRNSEILQSAEHAPVPTSIEEVKKFVYVLECDENGDWGWEGEWLNEFPKFRKLSSEDAESWISWVESNDIQSYLLETIEKCKRLAELNSKACGFATFSSKPV